MHPALKKLVLAPLLAIASLSIALPQKAEAGLVLAGAGAWVINGTPFRSSGPDANVIVGGSLVALGVPTMLAGLGLVFVSGPLGALFLVLDADGSFSQNQLQKSLAQRYPFIRDRQTLQKLAATIAGKASPHASNDDKVMTGFPTQEIRIPAEEIRAILEPTDLLETHPTEVAQMMLELQ